MSMKLQLSKCSLRNAWADLEDTELDSWDEPRRRTCVTDFPTSEQSELKNHSRSLMGTAETPLEESSSASASSSALFGSEESGRSSSTPTAHQDETGAVTLDYLELTVGSRGHGTGDCSPCFFAHRRAGCQNGSNCPYCHLTHQQKQRPCKGKRNRFHKVLESMRKDLDENAEDILNDPNWVNQFASRLPSFVDDDKTLKARVLRTLSEHAERVLRSKNVAVMRDERLPETDPIAGPPHLMLQISDPNSSGGMHQVHTEYVQGRQSKTASCGKACFRTSL